MRYAADELASMRRRGEGFTDFARLDDTTDEELEATIDHAEEGGIDGNTIQLAFPNLSGG